MHNFGKCPNKKLKGLANKSAKKKRARDCFDCPATVAKRKRKEKRQKKHVARKKGVERARNIASRMKRPQSVASFASRRLPSSVPRMGGRIIPHPHPPSPASASSPASPSPGREGLHPARPGKEDASPEEAVYRGPSDADRGYAGGYSMPHRPDTPPTTPTRKRFGADGHGSWYGR